MDSKTWSIQSNPGAPAIFETLLDLSGLAHRPKRMWKLWISNRDVSCHAVRISFAGEDSECEGGFLEHPLPVRAEGWVLGDTGEADALTDQLEGRFGLLVSGLDPVGVLDMFCISCSIVDDECW